MRSYLFLRPMMSHSVGAVLGGDPEVEEPVSNDLQDWRGCLGVRRGGERGEGEGLRVRGGE